MTNVSKSRTQGDITYRLEALSDGSTRVHVDMVYVLQGPLAQFSRSGLVKDFVRRMVADFGNQVSTRLGGRAGEADRGAKADSTSDCGLARAVESRFVPGLAKLRPARATLAGRQVNDARVSLDGMVLGGPQLLALLAPSPTARSWNECVSVWLSRALEWRTSPPLAFTVVEAAIALVAWNYESGDHLGFRRGDAGGSFRRARLGLSGTRSVVQCARDGADTRCGWLPTWWT